MKVALVTGGARGIGLCTARRLVEEGFEVQVADRVSVSEPLPGVSFHSIDISQPDEVFELAATLQTQGGVDVLVNNAGVRGATLPVTEYPLEEWESVLRINLTGAFLCCRAFARQMQEKKWGRIVNISSMAGKCPYPLRSAYAASKWGLIGLTLTLAQELGEDRITVNAVCPGPVANPGMERVLEARATAAGQSVAAVRDEFLRRQAIPEMPREEDVANLVAFLASEAAWSITGQAIDVSSGYRA
ncbi:MAG: SDR family oxidoreductase [Acidobacteriota bacterium]